ncbi:hypothetical protein [Aureimonas jatrophae]|uniref:DUF2946 domain-containing protein n=1 Tax=Aureimonas jatrophae TaxID=1166073 RepID=A0A1H0KLC1_9HYPH|nr:hypothetical protein [Aureimonas jatrophae]MBB3948761.1 hypothetical protein [Aureimonas jatrophae]SDO56616.1 hypothetical protein SAMN05192530_10831 [Aureimonas jatrophae]
MLLLLAGLVALASPVAAVPREAHPLSQTMADCAGHDEPTSGARHADLCCAFHCAPAIPIVAPAAIRPIPAPFRYARPADEDPAQWGRPVPVPPPRVA